MVIIVSSMNNNEFWFLLMNDLRTCGTASERHITVDAFRIRPGPKCSRRSCQAKRWSLTLKDCCSLNVGLSSRENTML